MTVVEWLLDHESDIQRIILEVVERIASAHGVQDAARAIAGNAAISVHQELLERAESDERVTTRQIQAAHLPTFDASPPRTPRERLGFDEPIPSPVRTCGTCGGPLTHHKPHNHGAGPGKDDTLECHGCGYWEFA